MTPLEVHISSQVSRAQVRLIPFPHIYVPEIFPLTLYGAMCESLPPADYVERCSPEAPNDNSRLFDLTAATKRSNGLDDLAGLWHRHFGPAIEALHQFVPLAFHDALARYFKQMGWSSQEIKPGQALFCFRAPGWQIRPHTHGLTQLLQTMVYFPSGNFHAGQGTYLYRFPWFRRAKINRDLASYYRWPQGPATLLPFAHNTLVSWINTPRALHGTIDHAGDPPRRYIFLAHTHAAE